MSRKNEQAAIKYVPKSRKEDEADLANFLCMICASMGLFMRSKMFLWMGLFLILSLFCRKRSGSSYSQFLMTTMMIIFGMVSVYYMSPPVAPPQK